MASNTRPRSRPAAPAATPAPTAAAPRPLRQLRASDLRGVARLATQATTGITRVVEGVHQSVLGTLGLPGGAQPGQARGFTGLVYQSIRGVTRLVDAGLQAGLQRLEPLVPLVQGPAEAGVQWERQAVMAALNGVMGDRLQADHNPLCTPMGFYQQGLPLDPAALGTAGRATGKLLVLVHGLCMNDLQWQRGGHDHGAYLALALGYTPVYLRYNTGLHTSTNGAELSRMLDALVAAWPVPVTDVAILAHSMGGLVARSACQHAAAGDQAPAVRWQGLLRHLVCLGTPHHGAPLERAGSWVDVLLGSSAYSRPFARLAQLRSAGITDLRYGHVCDADWAGRDRFRQSPDQRTPVPLPPGVACCTVAATLAVRRSPVAERLLGDGLVPLRSALGIHDDARRCLQFAQDRQAVFHGMGHLAMLDDVRVARQVEQWLTTA
ncbi:triacylglycerol lipase [Acidovorax sp. Leaf78]|uniref:esterase/lipase family protein n=1 Tax=unclassified Acidovorax TaxID=2684926 RepID=UPI0009EB3E9B|nr:permease [Acidovorax sp. Leaf78]